MSQAAPDIADLLTLTDGLLKPQWDAIACRIEAHVVQDARFAAWTAVVRQWLTAMCAALGEGYETAESEHFIAMAPPTVVRSAEGAAAAAV